MAPRTDAYLRSDETSHPTRTPMTRGVVFVHSAPTSLCPHVV